jgi:hypothetical protein
MYYDLGGEFSTGTKPIDCELTSCVKCDGCRKTKTVFAQ